MARASDHVVVVCKSAVQQIPIPIGLVTQLLLSGDLRLGDMLKQYATAR